MFIDTHSHLYLGELQHHIPEAISHLRESNFSHTIQIATSIEASQTCINLAHEYGIVKATVGIHPCEAQDIPVEKIPEQLATLENMIQTESDVIVWFGEIGFDHYHLSKNPEEAQVQKTRQIAWFHAQAELAQKYDQLSSFLSCLSIPGLTASKDSRFGILPSYPTLHQNANKLGNISISEYGASFFFERYFTISLISTYDERFSILR